MAMVRYYKDCSQLVYTGGRGILDGQHEYFSLDFVRFRGSMIISGFVYLIDSIGI